MNLLAMPDVRPILEDVYQRLLSRPPSWHNPCFGGCDYYPESHREETAMIPSRNYPERILFQGYFIGRGARTKDTVVTDLHFQADKMIREIAYVLHITRSVRDSMNNEEARP